MTNDSPASADADLLRAFLREYTAIANLIRQDQFKYWAELGVTMTQMKVLMWIDANGPGTVSALADALGVHVSTMTGVLDRLVDHGLVQREEGRDDRRLVVCSMTVRGRDLIAQLNTTSGAGRLERAAAIMDRQSLEHLVHGLHVLVAAWQADGRGGVSESVSQ